MVEGWDPARHRSREGCGSKKTETLTNPIIQVTRDCRVSTRGKVSGAADGVRTSVFIQAGRIQRARSIVEATAANGEGTADSS